MKESRILGEIIRQKIREDGRTAQVIALELGMSRGNLDKIYHKESVNSDLLARLCISLNYDFFQHVNPFRSDEFALSRGIHPAVGRAEDPQSQYLSPSEQIRDLTTELDRNARELEFLEQNLRDLKKSLADKDEIISLQKDKIAYLTEQLDELKEKDKKDKKIKK
jgi:transcriptional regulator with XRE-family HTH domain